MDAFLLRAPSCRTNIWATPWNWSIMVRKVRDYTAIGDRITTLGKRQREIAGVLGVSQQTVSKKLRGETAILLSDFEKIAAHYKVPLTYFFEEAFAPHRKNRIIDVYFNIFGIEARQFDGDCQAIFLFQDIDRW